jgi:hypothetical protein
MKKLALVLLVAVSACLFVSGCNNENSNPAAAGTNAPTMTNAPAK